MIKTITLKNFRTHKESILELSEGLNVIKGDNEAGKTNVLRALDWVVNNRPSGDDMCSYWGGDTSVGIEIENKLVQRHRLNNGQNLYTMTHADGEEDEFRAFGKGVPDAVREHLNIKPVNMHSQMDGPFLLNQSPPDVARYFNSIVNLDVIDRAIKGINKILSKDKSDLSYVTEQEEKLNESIAEYDWLEKAEGCVVKLEATRSQLQAMDRDLVDLKALVTSIRMLEAQLSALNEIVKHESALLSLDDTALKIDALSISCHDLGNLLSERYELEFEVQKCQDMLSFEPEVDILIEMRDEMYKNDIEIRMLQMLITKLDKLNEEHEFLTDQLLDLEAEWHKLMPDTCPLCGK